MFGNVWVKIGKKNPRSKAEAFSHGFSGCHVWSLQVQHAVQLEVKFGSLRDDGTTWPTERGGWFGQPVGQFWLYDVVCAFQIQSHCELTRKPLWLLTPDLRKNHWAWPVPRRGTMPVASCSLTSTTLRSVSAYQRRARVIPGQLQKIVHQVPRAAWGTTKLLRNEAFPAIYAYLWLFMYPPTLEYRTFAKNEFDLPPHFTLIQAPYFFQDKDAISSLKVSVSLSGAWAPTEGGRLCATGRAIRWVFSGPPGAPLGLSLRSWKKLQMPRTRKRPMERASLHGQLKGLVLMSSSFSVEVFAECARETNVVFAEVKRYFSFSAFLELFDGPTV